MRKSLVVACTFLASVLSACAVSKPRPQEAPAVAPPEPLGTEFRLMRNPVVSPDGARVAFSHQGDIWVAPLVGGMPAMRVTAQPSREDTCLWTPDGRSLVFTSNRFGNNDLFVVDLVGGEPRRLTHHSADDRLMGLSPDGKWVRFTSEREEQDLRRHANLFEIAIDGGTERRVSGYALTDGRVSPDGTMLAFTRGAESWWRKDYRGAANLDVYVANTKDGGDFKALTTWEGNDFGPMWATDGRGVYVTREKDRATNLWFVTVGGGETQVTNLPTPGVRFASLNARGTHLAFESGSDVHTLEIDPANPARPLGEPRRVRVSGFLDLDQSNAEVRVSNDVGEYALSPDGKMIACVSGGEIFVMERKKGDFRRTRRVTDTAAKEHDICFSPDSKSVLFVSDTSGEEQIWRVKSDDAAEPRLTHARKFAVEKVTETPGEKSGLELSPDHKTLSYVRGLGDLVLADPVTLEDKKTLDRGFSTPSYNWSPDSRWIVLSKDDNDFNTDVWIFDTTGAEAPYNVSRHPDEDTSPAMDGKGRFIAFITKDGLLNDTDLAIAWLRKADAEKTPQDWDDESPSTGGAASAPSTPGAAPGATPPGAPGTPGPGGAGGGPGRRRRGGDDAFDAPQDPPQDAAAESRPASRATSRPEKKVEPVVIEFKGLHKRTKKVVSGEGRRSTPAPSPDGKSIAFNQPGTGGGLMIVGFDGKDKKALSPTPASQLKWDGDELWHISGGEVGAMSKSGSRTGYALSGTRTRYPREERRLVFREAWRKMRDHFYDEKLHGADWNAAYARFEPMAMDATTSEDLAMVVTLLLGELNGSHLGFTPSQRWSSTNPSSTAQLGVLWDWTYSGPGLRVSRVLEDTPAAREKSKLLPGDVVVALEDRRTDDPKTNAWSAFDRLAGKEVRVTVLREGAEKEILMTPSAGLGQAVYNDRVERRQEAVAKATEGKVGYVHIAAMAEAEFLRFERELFAEGDGKSALIIDVRGNGGGSTADWLFTVLTQADHAITRPRGGGDGYPQDRRIFSAWTKPVVVLCDEFSYSNAEIFSHGIKTLKRGPVVGQTTYGAVISTGAFMLMDGSSLRNPFRGWIAKGNMKNMENNGCEPDYLVINTPADVLAGRDPQLDKAIELALKAVR